MTPLIYTSKGNIPIDQLEYKTHWIDEMTPVINIRIENGEPKYEVEKTGYMKMIEEYWLGDECVKRGCHVYTFDALTGQVEAGGL